MDRESLSEWAKDKPLSILQLDPADRAVLRIAVLDAYRNVENFITAVCAFKRTYINMSMSGIDVSEWTIVI
ncbi:unnamed protein product [Ceratitis capitata]|uniref:(Mediterranean fruit fly) hypothetical protein n=1 Tax=Ceratitis capitata TaxID=7213 RepID=A0A811V970_CERCA|nr:unnamed protein product [Ceratitis capitata]